MLCGLLCWAGLLSFYWSVKWLRILALTFSLLVIVSLVSPGKMPDAPAVRARYVDALRGYEGTRYVWGGENRLGLDCSGLVRKALVSANVSEGMRSLNPSAVRTAVSLWWNDCSARALGEGHRELTQHLFDAPSINQLDYAKLQSGDLAVTDDGVHVLAYLGEGNWIEADPDMRRVLVLSVPSTNTWFDTPVRLMRWRQFALFAQ
jgi:cell wall-associated NlpC family hydrolase